MRAVRLLFLHSYYGSLELLRQPMYVLSTLAFPAMFFWFFGVPNATDEMRAKLLTGSFSSFAVLGVVLFQFGVGIAQEKDTPWASYVRSLPVPSWVPLTARVISGIFFSALSVLIVTLVAHATTPLSWTSVDWTRFSATLALGAIPFGLMGLCLGLFFNAASSVPAANLIYLPLSFAGGLWLPPNALPKAVQNISDYLPTRAFAECVWAGLLGQDLPMRYPIGLTAYAMLFFALAIFLHRRHEQEVFA